MIDHDPSIDDEQYIVDRLSVVAALVEHLFLVFVHGVVSQRLTD